jgi:hypothetical protein
MAEEEDNKMADRWQKDADGILIFVSPHISIHTMSLVTKVNVVDWFILCYGRGIGCGLYSGPEAKFTGYLSILPPEHLSTYRRPKCISCIYPCCSNSATPLFSIEISDLDQFTVVPQFGGQSYMCPIGDIVTAVGTSIPHNHPTATV